MNTETTNTQQENENVLTEYLEGYQELELQSVQNNLRKTRNTILVVAVLLLISSFIIPAMSNAPVLDMWPAWVVVGLFVTLALFTNKFPLATVIIALILYIGLWVLDIVVLGPEYIFKGLLIKGIIIYFLVRGIGYAKEAEEVYRKTNRR
jgi:hypothetical protein